jgi:hypothetical protein
MGRKNCFNYGQMFRAEPRSAIIGSATVRLGLSVCRILGLFPKRQVSPSSTRSRHYSAGMATARGVRNARFLRFYVGQVTPIDLAGQSPLGVRGTIDLSPSGQNLLIARFAC